MIDMTETEYFSILQKPVREGFYKTKDYLGRVTMREFKNGWFSLPDAYIKSWCGLANDPNKGE